MIEPLGLAPLFVSDAALPARLGLVAATIAQLDPDAPPVDDLMAELDDLALVELDGVEPIDTPAQLMTAIFGTLGFRGNTSDYYNPHNSLLHRVLETRVGIPISLAIVAIETAAIRGVEVHPVGMPGHFLIGDGPANAGSADRWYDPMAGGAELSIEEVEQVFTRLLPSGTFDPGFLKPVSPQSVAERILNNLRGAHLRRGDLAATSAVLEAKLELPRTPPTVRAELAQLLATRGQFPRAIHHLEILAELEGDSEDGRRFTQMAKRLRATSN